MCIKEGEQGRSYVSYLQVSHLSLVWKGEPKSPGWLHSFHEPEVKDHLFDLEEYGGFFLLPRAPQSFAGFPFNWVLLHVLNT